MDDRPERIGEIVVRVEGREDRAGFEMHMTLLDGCQCMVGQHEGSWRINYSRCPIHGNPTSEEQGDA